MSVHGRDPPNYQSFIQAANRLYTQGKQTVSDNFEALKNSQLAKEINKKIPHKSDLQSVATILKETWPSSLKIDLSLCSIFHKNLSATYHITRNPSIKETYLYLKQNACSTLVKKEGIFTTANKLKGLEALLARDIARGNLSENEAAQMRNKLDNLKVMEARAKTYERRHWSREEVNPIIVSRLQMREGMDPISNHFPEELFISDFDKGILVDKEGKPFDNLRGPDGLTETRFKDFLNASGGDYEFFKEWMQAQMGDSANLIPNIMKYQLFLMRNQHGEENYYGKKELRSSPGIPGLDNSITEYYLQKTNKTPSDDPKAFEEFHAEIKAKAKNTLIAFLAYKDEFYEHCITPGLDKETQKKVLYRTESKEGIDANHIPYNDKDGVVTVDTNKKYSMKRNIYECSCWGGPGEIAGKEGKQTSDEKAKKGVIATRQVVDTCDIIYDQSLFSMKDLNPAYKGFGDKEREIGFITDGIKFNLMGDKEVEAHLAKVKSENKAPTPTQLKKWVIKKLKPA